MWQNGFLSVFLLVLLITAGGCQLAKLDDPIIVTDVEEEFYVGLIENLRSEPRSLQFVLTTIRKEPCENYRIQFNTNRIANRLNLSINSISKPEDCIPGEAPASATADFGSLENGYYKLSIDLKQTVFNEGQLTVSGDRYFVNMGTKEGIVFLHQELIKVPENTTWGYITFQTDADEGIAAQFIGELGNIGENKTLRRGYYGHFQILDDSGKVAIINQPGDPRIKTFLLHLPRPENHQELKDILESYRSQYEGKIEITALNDKGEEL